MALPAFPGLPDQAALLRRHWRLIAAVSCLAFAIALAVLSRQPPIYAANATLLYNPSTLPGAAALTPADEDAALASQSAVIASEPALRTLAAMPGLASACGFDRPGWWPASASAKNTARLSLAIGRALSVSIPPGSRLLEIGFRCANPDAAAAAANLAASQYLTTMSAENLTDQQAAQTWLQAQDAAMQLDLQHDEASLAAARGQTGQVAGMQGDLSAETASRITAALVDAEAALAAAQARLKSATGDGGAAAAIAPNMLPLRKEQADLAAQTESLARQYGADYPALIAARTSLAAINAEIADETGREIAAARAEVAADSAAVATLSANLDHARNTAQLQDMQAAPQQALTARADNDRAMLKALSDQADELAERAALSPPAARLLSPAMPPLSAEPARHGIILTASAIFGACLGILLAGFAESLNTSLRTGTALTAATGLACLALVPEAANPRSAALDQPFSLFAEQIRAIRTALALQKPGAILAITAARPSEGKTTLTIAIGRALAAAGQRVLIIDADIRQPSFELFFTTGHVTGLTDHLAGLAPLDAIIQTDPLSPLKLMTAGTQGRDALSLFLSVRLDDMLFALRASFDLVLIDVPPAFALAETQLLARAADAVLFCVRWGRTPRHVVQAALALLRRADVKFAGAILTRVDPARHRRSGFADAEMYQPRYGGYFKD